MYAHRRGGDGWRGPISPPCGRPEDILLVTTGQPNCSGVAARKPRTASRAAPTRSRQVAASAASGLPTFVVGVATTRASDNTVLNQLANAGGDHK